MMLVAIIKLSFILCFNYVGTTWAESGEEFTPLVITTGENTFENINIISVEDLITKAESWFTSDGDLEGYEIFHQDVDREKNITRYVHKEFSNITYQRNHMDAMQKVIILSKEEDGLSLDDNLTRIVFRQSSSHPKYYTGHIAYIRIFRGRHSVEWDVLQHEKDKPQEIFAAAFTPFTYGMDSVIRDSLASATAKQGRKTPYGKPKPNAVNQLTHTVKRILAPVPILGGLLGLNRNRQPENEEANETPNEEISEEKPNDAKYNKKPNKKAEEMKKQEEKSNKKTDEKSKKKIEEKSKKPDEEKSKKPDEEKSKKLEEKSKKPDEEKSKKPDEEKSKKPDEEKSKKPDEEKSSNESDKKSKKIAQSEESAVTEEPTEMKSTITQPTLENPVEVSAEDPYIPTKVSRTTRRVSLEKIFRFKRVYFPDSLEEDISPERMERQAPEIHTENNVQQTNSDVSNEKHEEETKVAQEFNEMPKENIKNDINNEIKQTKEAKKPKIIPDKIFENSQETSISVELSIEDGEQMRNNHRDGRVNHRVGSGKRIPQKNRKRGRQMQAIGTFFGNVNLYDSSPEKWLPEITDSYLNKDGISIISSHKYTSIFVVDYDVNEHPLFEDRSSPYTGILTCPYENVTLSSGIFLELTKEMKMQLVDFLLKSLRAQCLKTMRENTLNLFLQDMVTLGNDMKTYLNMDNELYKKKTLNQHEWNKVISAIYFSIYSDTYREHAEKFGKTRSPDFIPISQTLRTLTSIVIRGVDMIHELETHAVKISKSLINTLNERYLLTLKEAECLNEECNNNCQELMDINYQDRIQIRALKEFVIFGVEDTFGKKGSELENAFNEFYSKRLPMLTGKPS